MLFETRSLAAHLPVVPPCAQLPGCLAVEAATPASAPRKRRPCVGRARQVAVYRGEREPGGRRGSRGQPSWTHVHRHSPPPWECPATAPRATGSLSRDG